VRRLLLLCLGALLLVAGCGEGGVAGNAAVSIYAAAPLCAEAKVELRAREGGAGELAVRVVCLAPVERRGRADLAAAGLAARRATEDSTSVAYLEAPGAAARFGRPVIEAADIAWIETGSGSAAMRRVLRALADRGSSSPRAAVLDQVG
jgi:hypothetical protein